MKLAIGYLGRSFNAWSRKERAFESRPEATPAMKTTSSIPSTLPNRLIASAARWSTRPDSPLAYASMISAISRWRSSSAPLFPRAASRWTAASAAIFCHSGIRASWSARDSPSL